MGVMPIIPIPLEKEPDKLLHMTNIETLDAKINKINLLLADHQVLYQKYVAEKSEVHEGLVEATLSSMILGIKTARE